MFRIVILLFFLLLPLTQGMAQEATTPRHQKQVKLSFAPLVKEVAPAVVNIYAQRIVEDRRFSHPFFDDPFFQRFFGNPGQRGFTDGPLGGMSRKRVEQSLGSGVIVEPSGLIVTNAHVIQKAEDITVALLDGRQLNAEIVLEDEPTDIALIQITDEIESKLPHATLKPSDSLEVGDFVLAIGNPFGVGQTVTSGIVSALARSSLNINDYNFFIQTDAAINPGNSGGPLVAHDGGVVGINTAIFSRSGGSLGIGFAVPSEIVAGVISAHKSGKFSKHGVIRPWLGVTAQAISGEIADNLGLETTLGALITDIHNASPFKEAGLKSGDVIIEVNDHEIRSPAELKFRMTMVPIGQKATLTYIREGQKKNAAVITITPPDKPSRNITKLNGPHPLSGAVVGNLNPAFLTELGVKDLNKTGVAALDVLRGSSAARLGLEKGVIFREINGQSIENVKDLQSVMNAGPVPQGWIFLIEHKGQIHRIVIR